MSLKDNINYNISLNMASNQVALKEKLQQMIKTKTLLESSKLNKPVKKVAEKPKSSEGKPKIKKEKEEKKDKKETKKEAKKKQDLSLELNEDKEVETTRKWNDNKDRVLKKGPFDDQEIDIIMDSMCEYMTINDKTEEDMLSLVIEKQKKSDSKIWPIIAEKLPNRSVQSIHNFCHRALNPCNHQGTWSQDEIEKLVFYVKDKGTKWVEIGELLGRTSTNCKDKYKEIGGANFSERVKKFDLLTALKLFKYLNQLSSYNILKFPYLFSKNTKEPYTIENNELLIIDPDLKDERSEVIILNFLKIIIDFSGLEKLITSGEDIMYSTLSDKIKTKSFDDIKNFLNKILNELGLSRKAKIKQDLKMVKK